MTGLPEMPLALAAVVPVFDDWESTEQLLRELDLLDPTRAALSVYLVDDGSSDPAPEQFGRSAFRNLRAVTIIRLACNIGHQRAIATGLAYLHNRSLENPSYDAVLVMDGDGEDQPSAVPRLLDSFDANQRRKVIFAARARRTEAFPFKVFYFVYRTLYRGLTGVQVRFGNFSILPFHVLRRLTLMGDLWNNYPSTVLRSRLQYSMVPIDRGTRYFGKSHMNLVSLINHGVSALAVFSDVVATRILIGLIALFVPIIWAGIVVLVKYFITKEAITGWTSTMIGLILAISFQTFTLVCTLLFDVVGRRSAASFLPARDAEHFIDTVDRIWMRSGAAAESRSVS